MTKDDTLPTDHVVEDQQTEPPPRLDSDPFGIWDSFEASKKDELAPPRPVNTPREQQLETVVQISGSASTPSKAAPTTTDSRMLSKGELRMLETECDTLHRAVQLLHGNEFDVSSTTL